MNKDPYSVLGVSPNADNEEIKRAYRELAKKYHPDAYQNHPLAELAEEKMKEINEAYDTIIKQRENGYRNSEGYQHSKPDYHQIRTVIQMGDLNHAEQMLSMLSNRDAEWYFLMGSIAYRRGWFDEARANFTRAVNMSPDNPEYQSALNRIHNVGNAYTSAQGTGGDDMCQLCSGLICADCLCEACGGNLCPCIGCR